MSLPIKYIDLFCGMGSFHESFRQLGWECVMACDNSKAVQQTYKLNFGVEPLGDIVSIDPRTIPHFDILCAGFPCQPFSQCGKQKGFNDERGNLFFNIMKFVSCHHPSILIFENVSGLMTHDNGKTFDRICNSIKTSGYTLTHKILKASDYGLPQMRKRLFIVAVSLETKLNKDVSFILDLNKYRNNMSLSKYLGKNFKKETAYTIRCGGRSSPIDDRHNWDGYFVDDKVYRLSLRDCLLLQGFDKSFKLCGSISEQWKQIGNTIPTIFTKLIGKNINDILEMSY